MRLAINEATTMTTDLPNDIIAYSTAGFSYLEIWASKIDRYLQTNSVENLNELFRQYNICPVSINSMEFITFSSKDYVHIRTRCEELSALAQNLSCPYIVVSPGPTPSFQTTWEEIKIETVRALKDISIVADNYGIGIAFEPLGFGWCSVRTMRAAWEIIQTVNSKNIGIVLDAFHFYCSGSDLKEIEILDPARIFIFHLNDVEDLPKEAITDARRLLPGQGVLPLTEICGRLKTIEFDGICSVELFRPEYWDWSPYKLACEARRSALQVLEPYFQKLK